MYPGCRHDRVFWIQWFCLNQHGEIIDIAGDRYSCKDPEHLIALSDHDDPRGDGEDFYNFYGNRFEDPPEEIYNLVDDQVEERLTTLVSDVLYGKAERSEVEELLKVIPSFERQLKLFPCGASC